MGTVTGTTGHKLDLIKTYDIKQPYVVGVNGVTKLYFDTEGIETVEYTINGIEYITKLIKVDNPSYGENIKSVNINHPIGKAYIPNTTIPELDINYPTTFKYVTTPINEDTYFTFNDDVKMGVVFSPKIEQEVFIERQVTPVFEGQYRLANITTLQELEDYNNGYYNIVKTD